MAASASKKPRWKGPALAGRLKLPPIDKGKPGWFAATILDAAAETEAAGEFVGYSVLDAAAAVVAAFGVTEYDLEEAGPEVAPAEVVLLGVEAIILIVLLSIGLLALIMVILSRLVHNQSIGVSVGPWHPSIRVGAVFDPVLGLFEGVVHWIGGEAETLLADIGHIWYAVIKWVGGLGMTIYNDTIRSLIQTYVTPVAHSVSQLWSTVFGVSKGGKVITPGLTAKVAAAEAGIAHLRTVESTIAGEVHNLQGWEHEVRTSDFPRFQREIAGVNARISRVEKELKALLDPHHGLRAQVNTLTHEYTTIQEQLKAVNTRLKALEARPQHGGGLTITQQQQLKQAVSITTALAPLALLAPLTSVMVGNLKKLADDPCYCQNLSPGGSGGIVDAIVADLALKDGV